MMMVDTTFGYAHRAHPTTTYYDHLSAAAPLPHYSYHAFPAAYAPPMGHQQFNYYYPPTNYAQQQYASHLSSNIPPPPQASSVAASQQSVPSSMSSSSMSDVIVNDDNKARSIHSSKWAARMQRLSMSPVHAHLQENITVASSSLASSSPLASSPSSSFSYSSSPLASSSSSSSSSSAFSPTTRHLSEEQRAAPSNRLTIVLDLDHTLIHSHVPKTPGAVAQLAKLYSEQKSHSDGDSASGDDSGRRLHRISGPRGEVGYFRLRPGARRLLATCHKLFGGDVRVYSMGEADYVQQIMAVVDPKSGGHLVGQTLTRADAQRAALLDSVMQGVLVGDGEDVDEGSPPDQLFKDLAHFGAIDERRCVILDDVLKAWPRQARNVLQVFPFFYPWSKDSSAAGGGSSSSDSRARFVKHDTDKDRKEVKANASANGDGNGNADKNDTALHAIVDLLETLHSSLMISSNNNSADDGDVRPLLDTLQRRVLQGVCLAMTRVVPREMDPRNSREWQLAERLGARCVLTRAPTPPPSSKTETKTHGKRKRKGDHDDDGAVSLPEHLTHLLVPRRGTWTNRVSEAERRSHNSRVHIVTVDWLLRSAMTLQRADEALFANVDVKVNVKDRASSGAGGLSGLCSSPPLTKKTRVA